MEALYGFQSLDRAQMKDTKIQLLDSGKLYFQLETNNSFKNLVRSET